MKKALYLTLVFAFAAALSGVLVILRALVLPDIDLMPYTLVITVLGALITLLSLAALRFPGSELHTIYRRQFTRAPVGAFFFWATFGFGVAVARIDLGDLTFDLLYGLCFALLAGAIAASFSATRHSKKQKQ